MSTRRTGRLFDTGELAYFKARACDNATPGIGMDEFAVWVPERLITHGGYDRRPDRLTDGDLVAGKLGL